MPGSLSTCWKKRELHTWNSTTADIAHPDRVIFDLDPGEGIEWETLKEATSFMKKMLDLLGLESFLKTSGGKSLHVVVPLEPKWDYDAVKDFSENRLSRAPPGGWRVERPPPGGGGGAASARAQFAANLVDHRANAVDRGFQGLDVHAELLRPVLQLVFGIDVDARAIRGSSLAGVVAHVNSFPVCAGKSRCGRDSA